ncbi:hypothetical protein V8E36_001795 [Tilletia maclaganii]
MPPARSSRGAARVSTRAPSFTARGGRRSNQSARNNNGSNNGGGGGEGAGGGGAGGSGGGGGAGGGGGEGMNDTLNQVELDVINPSIMIWHRRLRMDAASTRLAVQSMQAQVEEHDDITDAIVVKTMETHCNLMQNRKLLGHIEGTGGVVQHVTSINNKLPTITPLLRQSDEVAVAGKDFLRSTTAYAFLSEAVPAYSKGNYDIANAVMAVVKNKPEELGSNGKHLLRATNIVGKKNVEEVINTKVNNMRFDMRSIVHDSIEKEKDLKALVEDVLGTVSDMEVTWNSVRRVVIWRRTAVLDGTKLPNGKWNDEYWAKVDERIEIYNSNIKKGEDGDPDALALARAYIQDMLDSDEERFGEFERPSSNSSCDLQNEHTNIFANGLDSNV